MENEHEQPRFVRSTAKVSAGTFCSRILGMARMSVMSGLFGASDANDAFVAAFKIPNLLRDMFAEGALSAAFIPVFTAKLKEAGRSSAMQTANLVLNFLLVVVGLLVLVGIFLVPLIVSALAPGFEDIPGKTELTVLLGRVMMPFLLIISAAALFMGMLNALGKFGTPAFAPTLLNIGMIASGFLICPFVSPPILGMAIGVLIGGIGQCLVQLPQLLKGGFKLRFDFKFNNPDLILILKLAAPMIIGLAATQFNVFVITNLASKLSDGAVSFLDYAYRLLHLPLGLFAVAIATVALPNASRLAAEKDYDGMGELYMRALRFGLFLVLPAQVVLLFAGKPIVALLYQHAEFTAVDTLQTSSALAFYAVGLAAYSSVRITVPMFYALKETRIPVAISVVSVAANIMLCFILMGHLDFRGLSLAVACSGWLNFTLLLLFLRRRIRMTSLQNSFRGLVMIVLPSILLAALLILGQQIVPCDINAGSKVSWLIYVIIMLLGAVMIYLGTAKILRLPELDSLLELIRKKK
jgi:putative peptidoglycan lipid II flippase